MLRISQLKLKIGHSEEELYHKICRTLFLPENERPEIFVRKQSLDARHKPDLYFVYSVDVKIKNERAVLGRLQKKHGVKNVALSSEKEYRFPKSGTKEMKNRPVVIGCGPAGLFCTYFLAAYGYRPILIEQGAPVEERQQDVEEFWRTGVLRPDSNVQFGEGGAGTFSDGKLNTLIKDPDGRNRKVLEIFADNGAPKDILYVNKPHIGTDVLTDVIRRMRERILKWGGEVRFHTRMTGLLTDDTGQNLCGISWKKGDCETGILETNQVVLAPGHSARDTFCMLYERKIPMEAKSFAVGVRAEHPQGLIDFTQYGTAHNGILPAASYKLTEKLPDGRGIYSFCMCPGGYVVNASSEKGMLAINGMSYHARDSRNANSAIVVTVTPEDFESRHPLAGIEFQRRLETAAYEAGSGRIPVQRYGDFYKCVTGEDLQECKDSKWFESHDPCMKGNYIFCELNHIFPDYICRDLVYGIEKFNKKIRGFSHPDTILSAVESRTSSPVRILRNDKTLESQVSGLYPCGEGAGYAGGITSAAADGIKVAEAIRQIYTPFDKIEEGLRKI